MTVWQFRKVVRFGVSFILLTVCASTQIAQTNAADVERWHKLDAGPFSILAPPGWEFHQLVGIDSFLGEFVGDGVLLSDLTMADTPMAISRMQRSQRILSRDDPSAGILLKWPTHERRGAA